MFLIIEELGKDLTLEKTKRLAVEAKRKVEEKTLRNMERENDELTEALNSIKSELHHCQDTVENVDEQYKFKRAEFSMQN